MRFASSISKDAAAALLRVLCNESRLMIFQLLVGRQMTVGEISLRTSKPQNDVSMNLEKLRKASLVQFKRKGKFRYYHIPDNRLTYLVPSIVQRFEAVKCNSSGLKLLWHNADVRLTGAHRGTGRAFGHQVSLDQMANN
ncbi:MAG: ArsR/SmtB family transcription factor [Hyphomicrobiaceae bacterium]